MLLLTVCTQAAGQSEEVSALYEQAEKLMEAGDLYGFLQILYSVTRSARIASQSVSTEVW